jgi:hypothetical protein
MNLAPVQDQAIHARMSLIVGSTTFDRLFDASGLMSWTGIFFTSLPRTREIAAEINDNYSIHIATIASGILKQ